MRSFPRSSTKNAPKRSRLISADALHNSEGMSRNNLVYESLREAIRAGVLKPGHRLVERDVATWLGVSRTPVRQVFHLLEEHGLASTLTGKGLVITDLSLDEVRELYTMWEELEGIAARHAAQHATDLDIHMLRRIVEQWDPKKRPNELLRLNREFHFTICRAAHNRFLVRALKSIDDRLTLLGATTYSIPGRPAEVAEEHAALLAAIAERDADAAEKAARKHMHRAGQLRMTMMMTMNSAPTKSSNKRLAATKLKPQRVG